MSGYEALLLGIPTLKAISQPVNTAAPSISGTVQIGTALTITPGIWTQSPTITRKIQRSANGSTSWSDVATITTSYTPVDADWGHYLRVHEDAVNAAGSGTATSSATATRVAELPTESVGGELVTNGNFSAWSGDNPTGWTVSGESGSNPMVTQVAPNGSAGTGAARLYSGATNNQPRLLQTILTIGAWYIAKINVTARTSGMLGIGDDVATVGGYNSTGLKQILFRAQSVAARILGYGTAPHDVVGDDASYRALTLNAQLIALSANMRATQYFTLPASPIQGTQIWLVTRVSDFAAGNYWLTLLEYTGSQWNITLYSVASHTRTSRASATNIGTTNGVRINQNGNTHTVETTANGGGAWTQRGVTVSGVTLYNTATGANAAWSEDVTIGSLQYEAAV